MAVRSPEESSARTRPICVVRCDAGGDGSDGILSLCGRGELVLRRNTREGSEVRASAECITNTPNTEGEDESVLSRDDGEAGEREGKG